MSTESFVFDVDSSRFERDVVEASHRVPVMVDFWAEWCGPCRHLTPVLDALAEQYGGRFLLAKVDTEAEPELAARHSIRSLPTVRLYRNAAVVEEFHGLQPEPAIRAMLDRHVGRDSDDARERARALSADGRWREAFEILEQALAADPDNHRIHPQLAATALELGRLDEAEAVLRSLPAHARMEDEARRVAARVKIARLAEAAPDARVLEDRIARNPEDWDARHRLSAVRALAGDYENAMEQLLEILRGDRTFGDDAGRKGLLALFEVLGPDHPLVETYRARLAAALY